MKRVLGMALATALVAVSLGSRSEAAAQQAAPQAAPQKLTFNGEVALWTVAIRPDKTADFEKIMARLRDALTSSDNQERRRQAAGWKVMRLEKPMPDGNIAYVHIINPVVPGADYTVMQILYDAFPEERQALYDIYRGAFAQNLSLATGSLSLDMAKTQQATTAAVTPAP